MFYNFLAVFSVIDNDASPLLMWITIASVIILLAVLVIISVFKKNLTTKTLAFAGLTVATSYALSFLKVSPVTYGGSITLASMLPICSLILCNNLSKGVSYDLRFSCIRL